MIASLREVGDRSPVIVVALDQDVEQFFQAVPSDAVTVIPLRELECADIELFKIKLKRSIVEYYFTLTSVIANFLMSSISESNNYWLCYLDADMFFKSSPDRVFFEHSNANILITPHNFPPNLSHLMEYGRFNVGFIAWRTNPIGRRCVSDYRERCLDWCFDRVEDGKFADQKYLDAWPENFDGVVELRDAPINVSYWNIGSYTVSLDGDQLFLNGEKLIAWHFSGLVTIDHWNYKLTHCTDEITSRPTVLYFYVRYIDNLRKMFKVASEKIGFPFETSLGRIR